MRKSKWIAGCLAAFFLAGCGMQVPGDVIQPDQMEEVLYDYHLSMSMSNGLRSDESYKKKAYQDYVFRKHGITEAEFDSSMVWYTRHTSELSAIYEKLDNRFKKDKQRISMSLNAMAETDFVSLPGDTVDAWPYRKMYWLTSRPLNNQFVFEITPDSNYHPKDAFLWKANYTFLADGQATMALNVLFENDSVIGQSRQIVRSGADSIYLHTDSAWQIKKINGFIYVAGDSDSVHTPNVIINDLSMTKFHALTDSINGEMKDSLDTAPQKETEVVKPTENIKRLDKPAPVKLKKAQLDE